MAKSADAFRTISELADWLGVQTHVLRFWESKFSQIKPVKRAGGRRYYRPADMLLIGGIRKLLHDDGLTIKGVQKILREEGIAYVSDMSHPLDDETAAAIDGVAEASARALDANTGPTAGSEPVETPIPDGEAEVEYRPVAEPPTEPVKSAPVEDPSPTITVDHQPETQPPLPEPVAEQHFQDDAQTEAEIEISQPAPGPADSSTSFPSFSHLSTADVESPEQANAGRETADAASEQQPTPSLHPRVIDVSNVPEDSSFDAEPSALTKATQIQRLSPAQRDGLRPFLAQLAALRDQMAGSRRDRH